MRLLLALLMAAPLAAQPVDVSVQIFAPDRVPLGARVHYNIPYLTAPGAVLELDIPGTVLAVNGGFDVTCTGTRPIRCTFSETSTRIAAAGVDARLDTAGSYRATARMIAADDPNPGNNMASVTTEVVAQHALAIDAGGFAVQLSPRQAHTFPITLRNNSDVPAIDAVMTVSLPAGGRIMGFTVRSGAGVTCSLSSALTCNVPRVTREESASVDVNVVAPDRIEGTPFTIDVEAHTAQPDFNTADSHRTFFVYMKRELLVTNTSDSGEGSLRQAMLDANALCLRRTPCNITFQIPAPVPGGGRFVIQPRTQLPALIGEIRVDGATQTQFTGDTNPAGPEIEINGALQPEGPGIRLSPNCMGEIYDLAVSGFPGHGIDVSRMPGDPAPEDCYVDRPTIQVFIARNHLISNMRGLALRVYDVTVENNVIRGNQRSGIFASEGTFASIRSNRIELNGASGLFLNLENARVDRNVIADNAHWGVARTARGDVLVTANSIFGNALQAIDIGLDGDTPANRPVLFWAIYDSTRKATIVRGRFDAVNAPAFRRIFLEVFASSALSRENQPQAERTVAEYDIDSGHADFEIAIPEDLRGQWITAASQIFRLPLFARSPGSDALPTGAPANTSELSNAVWVAP